jgi:tetratricopeptide (TPR) repeat protein
LERNLCRRSSSLTDTLVRRYTYGNFTDFPVFGPEADFLLGIPARQRELVSLARAQVLEQKRTTKTVFESNVAAAAAICRELSIQTEHLEQAIAGGAEAITLAIEDLGDRIAGELGEIRWELVQLRALSEQILAVLRRPRSTEARELLDQGVRNLVNDKVEQAEERFNLALRLDNTDYQILMNLSAVELRKGNALRAVAFVHDALTLPQNLDAQARADALWHLARIHYAIHEYPKAFELAQQSTTLVSAPRRVLQLGVYAILGDMLMEGLYLIEAAVRQDPRLFSVAASTPDLTAHQRDCLSLLGKLAAEVLNAVQKGCQKLAPIADEVGKLRRVPSGYSARFRTRFEAVLRTSRDGSYSECREALSILTVLEKVPDLLRRLDRSTLEFSQSQQAELLAKEKLALARKRFNKLPGWVTGCFSVGAAFGVETILVLLTIKIPINPVIVGGVFWLVLGVSLFGFTVYDKKCDRMVRELEENRDGHTAAAALAQSKHGDAELSVNAALERAGC